MTRIQMIDKRTGKAFLLSEGSNVIGRDKDADIHLDSTSISRKHCRVDCSGSSMIVRDLGSTNGTYVNGEATTRVLCDIGDVLRIGDFTFRLESVTEAQLAAIGSMRNADHPGSAVDSSDLMAGMALDDLESVDAAPESVAASDDLLNGLGFENLESAPEDTSEPNQTDLLADCGLENLETVVSNSDTTPGVQRPKKRRRPKRSRPVAEGPWDDVLYDQSEPQPAAPAQRSDEQSQTMSAAASALAGSAPSPVSSAAPSQPAPQPTPAPPVQRTQSKPIPLPKKKPKREKKPRDWSGFKKFLEEKTGLAVTLGICIALAAFFVVPWGSLFRTSDGSLLEFYEGVLAQVQEHRGQAPAEWESFAAELENENWGYVNELSSAGKLSVTAQQLLRAGKNDLPKILAEARTQECSAEQLFANRVSAARAAYEGTEVQTVTAKKENELLDDLEDGMFGSGG